MIQLSYFRQQQQNNQAFAMITAYDAMMANAAWQAGIQTILVGDSLGQVVQGQSSTTAVTVDDVVYHCRAVRAGAPDAFIMADMPFASYTTADQAMANAATMMQQGSAQCVKLEINHPRQVDIIQHLSQNQVPVCAHLGLLPQGYWLHGYKIAGKTQDEIQRLQRLIHAVQEANATLILLEGIKGDAMPTLMESIQLPTIGIGCGHHTNGQILVLQDVIGLTESPPAFSHNFMTHANDIVDAMRHYREAVQNGQFPLPQHTY